LVTKLDNYFPYRTVTRWLGGGLQAINKSFSISSAHGGVVTATQVMRGWGTNKVVVIGRNMDDRVVPYAQKLSQELGFNVVTIKQWGGFNASLTVEQNRQWVKLLKAEGYTIYDVGLDPQYTQLGNFDEGPYYGMELDELFR